MIRSTVDSMPIENRKGDHGRDGGRGRLFGGDGGGFGRAAGGRGGEGGLTEKLGNSGNCGG